MKQVLTLVVKLQPTLKQRQLLDDTALAFADACNYINKTVKPNLTNRNSIQAVCYQDVKERFGLTANHVVRACARVASNRLTAKQKGRKVKNFKPTSFDCDARTFRFIETGYLASISTTGKRAKIPMRVSNYHRGKLSGQNPTSAQVCQHKDGDWYVHIQLKSDAPKPIKSDKVIGVDFGRRDIAVTSTNKSWSGKEIQEKRDKLTKVRASLQKKATQGTRSTRRRCRQILKRLSGKERRYQAWINHNISKAIIDEAKQTQSFVSIEDLTGIRERTNQQPRNKTERRRSNSWAFYQLRTFLEYKGIKEGIEVIAISPRYTSQTCHCCLHIGLRNNKSFNSPSGEAEGRGQEAGGKILVTVKPCCLAQLGLSPPPKSSIWWSSIRGGSESPSNRPPASCLSTPASFKCSNKACGWIGDADSNGSLMIALVGLSVRQPRGNYLLSCAIDGGLQKARAV